MIARSPAITTINADAIPTASPNRVGTRANDRPAKKTHTRSSLSVKLGLVRISFILLSESALGNSHRANAVSFCAPLPPYHPGSGGSFGNTDTLAPVVDPRIPLPYHNLTILYTPPQILSSISLSEVYRYPRYALFYITENL